MHANGPLELETTLAKRGYSAGASLVTTVVGPSTVSATPQTLPEVEHGQTNASFVVDLEERRLLGQRGPPCEIEYHEYAL